MEEYISNFLVDAQYKVAILTIEINNKKGRDHDFKKEYLMRLELSIWISVLYEAYQDIYNGYNFLGNWTDTQIKEECEYLRAKTGITRVPYLTFASYAPEIVVAQQQGDGVPAGSRGYLVTYNASNQPISAPAPVEGGMLNMTIDEYFSSS